MPRPRRRTVPDAGAPVRAPAVPTRRPAPGSAPVPAPVPVAGPVPGAVPEAGPVPDAGPDFSRVPVRSAPLVERSDAPVPVAVPEAVGSAAEPDVVEDAVSVLLTALAPIRGTPAAAGVWRRVVAQIRKPTTHRIKGVPVGLYDPAVVAAVTALAPPAGATAKERRQNAQADAALYLDRQRQVLEQVFADLLTTQEERLHGTPGDPAQEWQGLRGRTQTQFGGLAGYEQLRPGLLEAFGALDIGTAKAVAAMDTYYGTTLTPVTFLGRPGVVHPLMRDALERAERFLGDNRAAAAAGVSSFGTAAVRANANNRLVLSEHSFGAAIDLDPRQNPNVPTFPAEFVRQVTGVDVLTTADGRQKDDPLDIGDVPETLFETRDPAIVEVERLLGASRKLVEVFRDEQSLAQGMWEVAGRLVRTPADVTPEQLRDAVFAALDEGPRVHWRYQDPKAVGKRALPGLAHDTLADMLYPPAPESPDVGARRTGIQLLITMVDVYRRSFVAPRKVRKGKPAPAATRVPASHSPAPRAVLPQLAVHGFLDLPLDLIVALRHRYGGDLRWLGSSPTHDFMHFELKSRPALYPGDPRGGR